MLFWKTAIQSYFKAVVHLFYPHICLQCGTDELLDPQIICSQCEDTLPLTHFGAMQNNPIEKIFWGRCAIAKATAILYFTKESLVQKLMIALKYKQNKKAGYLLGKLIANELIGNPSYCKVDYLVPIPISKKKLKKRGFNQSLLICESIITHGFEVPLFAGLKKIKETITQTQKNRLARATDINPVFSLHQQATIKGKHLLLIDDVITTGATLEKAYITLMQAQPASIQIVAAAYSYH